MWRQLLSATSYQIQLASDSSFTTGLIIDDSSLIDTLKSVLGLANNTGYCWRVRGRNVGGWGVWSSRWRFTTIVAPPQGPILVSPENGSTNLPSIVALTWSSPAAKGIKGQLFRNLGKASSDVRGSLPQHVHVSHADEVKQSNRNQSSDWAYQLIDTLTFHLELAADSLFEIRMVDDSAIVATTYQVGQLSNSAIYYWRLRSKNEGGWSQYSETWHFTTGGAVSNQYFIDAGWNIVSVPLLVEDARATTLFPPATSRAFAFETGGYIRRDTLDIGKGYWLKFASVDSVRMTGVLVAADTISVNAGWNLVGTISTRIDTASVVTVPSGIRASSYFKYVRGYVPADSLLPGWGYWVKTLSAGMLILRETPAAVVVKKSAESSRRD
jgi:hypothetical protein